MSATAHDYIENAMRTQLATMVGVLPIAWPNSEFTPTIGTPYLRFNILFATPSQNTLGTTGTNELLGFVQVDVVYPSSGGNGLSRAMVGKITEQFKRGVVPSYSGQTVTVLNAYPSGAISDADWYTVPVTINFRACTEN